MNEITILDGPIGTLLEEFGVDVTSRVGCWTGYASIENEELLTYLHYIYCLYGANVITTNTFSTTQRWMENWEEAVEKSVQACVNAINITECVFEQCKDSVYYHNMMESNDKFIHDISFNSFPNIDINKRFNEKINIYPRKKIKIAGSIAPLEDCWHPELSPLDTARIEHRKLAEKLKEQNVDLILCETFSNINEALIAVDVALETNLPVWLSLTPGYDPNQFLLTPDEIRNCFITAIEKGVSAILINCVPAIHSLVYIDAIIDLPVLKGIYANAGSTEDGIGWIPENQENGPSLYLEHVKNWIDKEQTIVGSCCGTNPYFIKLISEYINESV